MSPFSGTILGAVQGLTEFLPISSDGHLRLAHHFFAIDTANDLAFDIFLHIGTLIAVFTVYRVRIWSLIRELVTAVAARGLTFRERLETYEAARLFLLIIVASIPTGIIGVLGKDAIEGPFMARADVAGAFLIVNGFIIFSSKYRLRDGSSSWLQVGGIGIREALIIGTLQGVAILPGVSRSGLTITSAVLLGADRMKAAEYSFFLSIPAILGAVVLSFDPSSIAPESYGMYGLGLLTSMLVGMAALTLLLRIVKKASFHYFAFYCWALGLIAIFFGR